MLVGVHASSIIASLLLPQSQPVFSESFESDDALTAIAPIAHPANADIVADPDDTENHTLRITVNEADHYGTSFSVRLKDHLDTEPTRLYFSYRIRLSRDWMPKHTGKLPGFGGTYNKAGWGGKPSDGTNGWSARGMFGPVDATGATPIGSYIYHADMVDTIQTYGNGEWWDAHLERERWYTIEQEIKLESVGPNGGNADGWLKAWVDGTLVFHREHLHVRDIDTLRIERAWLNVYYGGKTPAPSTMSLLIDDILVARQRSDTQVPTSSR